MRTSIEFDHDLMVKALKAGGFKTRKAAVEEGLRLLVRTRAQGRLRGLRGKNWASYFEAASRGSLPARCQSPLDERSGHR